MLLKHLADHARHRSSDLPPPYYRERTVRWAIQLNPSGRSTSESLISLVDEDQPHGRVMPTPSIYRSGQKPPPTLIVDTLRYVCALPKDDSAKEEEEACRRNDDYVALIHRWREAAPNDPRAAALVAFFAADGHLNIMVPEAAKPDDTVAFRITGDDTWVHLTDSAVAFWQQVVRERKSSGNGEGICLACGEPGPLLDTIPEPIKAGAIPVANGRGRETQLVSVNKPAQGRGGSIQLVNTPVCDGCGGRAMAALNALLADPDHRYRGRDSVLVWWLRDPVDVPIFQALERAEPADIRAVFDELDRARPGHDTTGVDTNAFYAVTLSANQSRAVLRDWVNIPLTKALTSITEWFDDHRMADPWNSGPRHVPLWRLTESLGHWRTVNGRDAYVPGTVPESADRDLLLCALHGRRHGPPVRVLQRLIQRISADHRVDLPRAALLRLALTRPPYEVKIMPELDEHSTDIAYRCGRLFAVLETIQWQALSERVTREDGTTIRKGPNTTTADKFFGAAMTTPLAVLTMLRTNATGHLKRLRRDKPGAAHGLNMRLDALYEPIKSDLPATLDLVGQGRFILGYHHQRAAERAARANAKPST